MNPDVNATQSCLTVFKPGSANVTAYTPGRKSTTLKRPLASVTTVRTFSISAGLDASTVTPGSTAPDVSLTMPAIVACAYATTGVKAITATHRHGDARFASARMSDSSATECVMGAGVILRVQSE